MNYRDINTIEELNKLISESEETAQAHIEEHTQVDEGYKYEDEDINKEQEADDEKKADDKLEVIYADEGYGNIFKHIIMFTNNRDPKDNKTLNNIYEAIENIKKQGKDVVVPKLHVFVAEETNIEELGVGTIKLQDAKCEVVIEEESN